MKKNIKRLFLIRHGEGVHNVDWYTYGEQAYYMKEKTDPHLTNIGVQQAKRCGETFKEINNIELVITSPMMRCLQTMDNVFKNVDVPVLANENAREYPMSLQYANKRSKKSELEKLFSYVDFSNLTSEEDNKWNSERLETREELNIRKQNLLDFIKKRPEKNIAIVSHSTYIMNFLYNNIDENHDKELKHCFPYEKVIQNTDYETHMESSC
jgi:broad specificity phosphatase PhoE